MVSRNFKNYLNYYKEKLRDANKEYYILEDRKNRAKKEVKEEFDFISNIINQNLINQNPKKRLKILNKGIEYFEKIKKLHTNNELNIDENFNTGAIKQVDHCLKILRNRKKNPINEIQSKLGGTPKYKEANDKWENLPQNTKHRTIRFADQVETKEYKFFKGEKKDKSDHANNVKINRKEYKKCSFVLSDIQQSLLNGKLTQEGKMSPKKYDHKNDSWISDTSNLYNHESFTLNEKFQLIDSNGAKTGFYIAEDKEGNYIVTDSDKNPTSIGAELFGDSLDTYEIALFDKDTEEYLYQDNIDNELNDDEIDIDENSKSEASDSIFKP